MPKKYIFISSLTVILFTAFYFVGFQAFGQTPTPTPTVTPTPSPTPTSTPTLTPTVTPTPVKSLTLTSPNGGEQFVKDQIYTIKWISSGIKTIAIDLYKGGSLYLPMAKSIENTGAWSWAPASGIPNGNDYKLRVSDSSDSTIYDESDNYFSIVAAGMFSIADVSGIKSSYTPDEKITLSVKGIETDGSPAMSEEGFNVQVYIYDSPRSKTYAGVNGSYNSSTGLWDAFLTAPSDASLAYDLEVFLYCANDNAVCATKYGRAAQVTKLFKFTLTSVQPSITVLSPNGGESWQVGSTQKISWQTNNIISPNDKITIYISPATDLSKNINLAQEISNSGFYSYTVDDPNKFSYRSSLFQAGNQFKILICAKLATSNNLCSYASDWSDAAFSIVAASQTSIQSGLCVRLSSSYGQTFTDIDSGSISVIGQIYYLNALPGITAGANQKMNFYAYMPSGGSNAYIGTAVAGSVEDATAFLPNRVLIATVVSGSNPTSPTSSFGGVIQSITSYAPGCANYTRSTPSITVISPNGGEAWEAGKTYTIQWKSTGISADTKINLQLSYIELNSTDRYEIAMFPDLQNTGSYSWTISDPLGDVLSLSKLKPDQFKMRVIYSTGTVQAEDYSDSTFSIISATPAPTPVPTSTPISTPAPIPTKGCGDQCIALGYASGACTNATSCDMYGGPDLGETFDCKSCPLGFISGTKDCLPPGEKVRCCCEKVRQTPIPSPSPTLTPIPQPPTGYYRSAYWQCYDGVESNEGGPTSCKSSETWQKYADEFCYGHCYADNSKCGVNTFKVGSECPSGIVCNIMVDCASDFFPVKTGEKDKNGCPIIKCEKEKPVPTTPPSTAGCQTDEDCQTGGCNNELCFKKGFEVSSICLWKPEYECFKKIGCKCVDNKCQWQQTSDFRECLSKISEAEENRLIKVPGKPDIYVIKNGKLHHIPSWNAFVAAGYKMEEVKPVEEEEIINKALVNLIRIPDDPKVYVVGKGLVRHIPNPEVFSSYGFNWGDIVTVSPAELKEYGQANLIRGIGEAKVYLVENGQKRWIETAETFQKRGYDWSKITEVNNTEINAYPTGGEIK